MSGNPASPRFGSRAVDTAVMLTQAEALLARSLGRVLAGYDMSWPQALSLFVLAEQEGPISATRLVEQLGLGRTAMTSVVDRLERHGWVQRRPSAKDRRVAHLVLTDRGHEIVNAIRPLVRGAMDVHFARVAPADLTRWREGLDRLTAVLRDGAPPGADA